ncbi:hypothetical protein IMZ48_02295 [Candidatus Bathyarchaeota archaeon]|nr:hypothetical protein [Candidatus Bathyarchaeota archaeon]
MPSRTKPVSNLYPSKPELMNEILNAIPLLRRIKVTTSLLIKEWVNLVVVPPANMETDSRTACVSPAVPRLTASFSERGL